MASLPKPGTKVLINSQEIPAVRSVDIRLAAAEIQVATLVLHCNDIQIAEDGTIYIKTSD